MQPRTRGNARNRRPWQGKRRDGEPLALAAGGVVALRSAAARKTRRGADVGFAADTRTVFLGAMRCADVAVVIISALAAHYARLGSYDLASGEVWEVAASCLLAANALEFARVYDVRDMGRQSSHLGRVATAWIVTNLAVVAAIYFTKTSEDVSRGWVLLWAVFGFGGLFAVRLVAWRRLARWRSQGRFVVNVAVVGDGPAADCLARNVEEAGNGYSRVVGVFGLTAADGSLPAAKSEATRNLDDLVQLTRKARIDEIAISLPCPNSADVSMALAKLGTLPIDVKLCPDLPEPRAGGVAPRSIPAIAVLTRPLAGWPIVVKRCMDVAMSALLLLSLAPFMVVVAFSIKLDSAGPILFRQRRFGFNKNPFTVFKFRTMHVEAALDTSVPQARRNDPRVTRLGRLLRRTSIDELPQLANVLRGTMSLVGPRPHAIAHDERYAVLIDGYLARHRVVPGITGWAQVNGYRGETETIEKMTRRIEHDLYYIDNWSPMFDIYILLRTAVIGFCDTRAY
jgi:Undecaprenyl-phosphate glucose phosphotransferase